MRSLGIVLAGGAGTRLGAGVPKALAPFAHHTLLAQALATLAPIADDIVVAAPATMALPVSPAQRAHDAPDAAGPLAGLVAGMSARRCERAVVLAVDLPLVSHSLLAAMGERLGDALALVPAPGGYAQPLAAWYSYAALAPLAAALAAGARAVVPAVTALPARMLDDAALAALGAHAASFHNVNTPAELAEAQRLWAREGVA